MEVIYGPSRICGSVSINVSYLLCLPKIMFVVTLFFVMSFVPHFTVVALALNACADPEIFVRGGGGGV